MTRADMETEVKAVIQQAAAATSALSCRRRDPQLEGDRDRGNGSEFSAVSVSADTTLARRGGRLKALLIGFGLIAELLRRYEGSRFRS